MVTDRTCTRCKEIVCLVSLSPVEGNPDRFMARPRRASKCKTYRGSMTNICCSAGDTPEAALAEFPHLSPLACPECRANGSCATHPGAAR